MKDSLGRYRYNCIFRVVETSMWYFPIFIFSIEMLSPSTSWSQDADVLFTLYPMVWLGGGARPAGQQWVVCLAARWE